MTSSDDLRVRSELRAAVRRCLDRSDGPRPYLAGEPGTREPFDRKLWHVLTAEIGVTGLVVPEEIGGAAADFADLAAVAEELGRGIVPVPFLSTVGLAVITLVEQRSEPAAHELLTRLIGPDATATVAWCAADGAREPNAARVRADSTPAGWRVSGTTSFVVDGFGADVILLPAEVDGALALFSVDAADSGVRAVPMQTLDLLRPLATITFDGAVAELVSTDAELALNTSLDCTLVLLAAEQVGGAQHCLDQAVAYAKQRVQFDRPIGSFQAIKHKLVDVLLDVEMARSAAAVAARAADAYIREPTEGHAKQLATTASLAKSMCGDAYVRTAAETLHVHGGIGFTWEHDAHLHFRRAKAGQLFLGSTNEHRDRLASYAGLASNG